MGTNSQSFVPSQPIQTSSLSGSSAQKQQNLKVSANQSQA